MMYGDIQFFTEDIDYTIREKGKIRECLAGIIAEENFRSGPINFIYCSDVYLLRLNRKYLKRDSFTDVIAFNLSEIEGYISGDIFISIERIRENAMKYGVRINDEIQRVMIHGVLHLMGMEDDTAEGKEAMRLKENHYLSRYFRY